MFDIAPSELLAVAVVALVVIGPKDLPKAMRFVGFWVGRARGVARQFRSGIDTMMREAELAELEKQWAEENRRIMAEHSGGAPVLEHAPAPPSVPDGQMMPLDHAPVAAVPVVADAEQAAPSPADSASPVPQAGGEGAAA